MIKRLCVLWALLLTVACAGCGGGGSGSDSGTTPPPGKAEYSTPDKTISALNTALKANSVEDALQCFRSSDQDRMKVVFESLDQNSRNDLADKIANAHIIQQTETTRIYQTSMDNGDGKMMDVRFGLILIDGKWMVWF